MFEKAEDPEWVAEKKLKIDYSYYFTNQLKKPVCDLLEPLLGKNVESVIFEPKTQRITDFFTRYP
jgi:DNA polymerase delta subunit 1